MLTLWAVLQATLGMAQSWDQVSGQGRDISVGANGHVWLVGTKTNAFGFDLFARVGNDWKAVPGSGVRIAAHPNGEAWVANVKGEIWKLDINGGATRMPGSANDIGIGANGHVWVVGTNPVPGGYGIHRWSGNGWSSIPGGAVRVAVDPQGVPWVVNDGGTIFRLDPKGWQTMPGGAKDIGIGANGAIWITGTDGALYRWTGSGWGRTSGIGTDVAVDKTGRSWHINGAFNIYTEPGARDLAASAWPQPSDSLPPPGKAATQTAAQDARLSVLDAAYYLTSHSDLKVAFGNNLEAAKNHWLSNGLKEGRQSATNFSIRSYVERYQDLKAAFGNNYEAAFTHWLSNGLREGRSAAPQNIPAPSAVSSKVRIDLAGRLVRGDKDAAIYLVDTSGFKRHIVSPQVLSECGLNLGSIQSMTPADVNGMATGATITSGTGCLMVKATQIGATTQPSVSQPSSGEVAGNKLLPGKSMEKGQQLVSPNSKYKAVFQPDGNFVLLDMAKAPAGLPRWSAQTRGDRITLQADGNLVILAGNNPVWASHTSGNKDVQLVLHNNGKLALWKNNQKVWLINPAMVAAGPKDPKIPPRPPQERSAQTPPSSPDQGEQQEDAEEGISLGALDPIAELNRRVRIPGVSTLLSIFEGALTLDRAQGISSDDSQIFKIKGYLSPQTPAQKSKAPIIGTVLGLGKFIGVPESVPMEISLGMSNAELDLAISFGVIDTWQETALIPNNQGIGTKLAFKGLNLVLHLKPSVSGFTPSVSLVGDIYARLTSRDQWLYLVPSVSLKSPTSLSLGGSLYACEGTPSRDMKPETSCKNKQWNLLGLGVAKADGGLLKVGLDVGPLLPPVLTGVEAEIKNVTLGFDSSGVKLDGVILVDADVTPGAGLILQTQANAKLSDFTQLLRSILKPEPFPSVLTGIGSIPGLSDLKVGGGGKIVLAPTGLTVGQYNIQKPTVELQVRTPMDRLTIDMKLESALAINNPEIFGQVAQVFKGNLSAAGMSGHVDISTRFDQINQMVRDLAGNIPGVREAVNGIMSGFTFHGAYAKVAVPELKPTAGIDITLGKRFQVDIELEAIYRPDLIARKVWSLVEKELLQLGKIILEGLETVAKEMAKGGNIVGGNVVTGAIIVGDGFRLVGDNIVNVANTVAGAFVDLGDNIKNAFTGGGHISGAQLQHSRAVAYGRAITSVGPHSEAHQRALNYWYYLAKVGRTTLEKDRTPDNYDCDHSRGRDSQSFQDGGNEYYMGQVNSACHWLQWGLNRGTQSALWFSPDDYLASNPDVAAEIAKKFADLSARRRAAMNHWVNTGFQAGRIGSKDFWAAYYMYKYRDEIKRLAKEDSFFDPDADYRDGYQRKYEVALGHYTLHGQKAKYATVPTVPGGAAMLGNNLTVCRILMEGRLSGGGWNDSKGCQSVVIAPKAAAIAVPLRHPNGCRQRDPKCAHERAEDAKAAKAANAVLNYATARSAVFDVLTGSSFEWVNRYSATNTLNILPLGMSAATTSSDSSSPVVCALTGASQGVGSTVTEGGSERCLVVTPAGTVRAVANGYQILVGKDMKWVIP